MANISQVKHQKVYKIALGKATDIGSGVRSISVYAQASTLAFNTTTDANFDNATLLGKVIDVDTTPSYSKKTLTNTSADNKPSTLGLRNKDSELISTAADKVPAHSPDNIYAYDFDTYINGSKYYFWALADDKSGNLEPLNASGRNSQTWPLKETQVLFDDIAPEFYGLETFGGVTYNSTPFNGKNYYIPSASLSGMVDQTAIDYFEGKIISFNSGGSPLVRFIGVTSEYNTDKLWLDISYSGITADPSGNTITLLPNITVDSGVGYLETHFPNSNDVNLAKYKIERLVNTDGTSNNGTTPFTLSVLNIDKESDIQTWYDAAYSETNHYTDRGLHFGDSDLTTNANGKKFLYKISPISRWTDSTGGEITGTPIYTTLVGVRVANYRPSAGVAPIVPTSASQVTNSDGTITLTWVNSVDANGDIKEYQVQRLIRLNGVNQDWTPISDIAHVNVTVSAGSFTIGKSYKIKTAGTTDFTAIGASANTVNTVFKATGIGAGTGTADLLANYTDTRLEPYEPDKIEYSYRVRAIDYASNVSAYVGFVGGTTNGSYDFVKAYSTGSVLDSRGSLTVDGKVGGWKGQISITTGAGDIEISSVDIWSRKASTRSALSFLTSADDVYLGKFFTDNINQNVIFTWMDAQSNAIEYAQFKFKLTDKFNNVSAGSSYTGLGVASETPLSIVDELAPSTLGFTITPELIVDPYDKTAIEVVLVTSASVFKVIIATGVDGSSSYNAWQSGIKADELAGKTFTDTLGESRTIQSNLVSNVGSPYNVQITLSTPLTTAPTVNDVGFITPTHARITVNKTDNLLADAAYTATSNTDFTEVIDTSKSWIVDQWKGWDANVTGGETRQVVSNSGTTLTLDAPLSADPTGGTYSITMPTSLAGFNIFRGKVISGTVSTWTLLYETKNPYTGTDTFDIVDDTIGIGEFKYGITSYTLSNRESNPILESSTSVISVDETPPSIPEVQGVVGGAGSLLIYWNRTADDIDHYELTVTDSGGAALSSGAVSNKSILGETHTIYGVTDTKAVIKTYLYKVVAFDASDNSLAGTAPAAVSTNIVFLDDYVPSTGTAPSILTATYTPSLPAPNNTQTTQTALIVVPDNDGNADITIPKASITDHTTALLVIERDTKPFGGSYSGTYTEIATLAVPAIDESTGNYITDVSFRDGINDKLIVKYRVKSISFGGMVSNDGTNPTYFTGANDYSIVDFTGYDLAAQTLGATIIPDVGKVYIKFKDVIDKNSATYEIWRTSDTGTTWASNFYSNTTVQPSVVSTSWEKIATLPSTLANNTQTDYVQYSDLDWESNGSIDSQNTILTAPYDAKAVYAVVGVDRWGNRGTPFFLPNSTNDANSVIYVPHEPRVNRIEKGAQYWNLNKGIQSSIGVVPINDPDAILYKEHGIEVHGDLKFNLNNLGNDYSIVVRRLQKEMQAQGLSVSNIQAIKVYDTRDEVDTTWAFSLTPNFPTVAVILAYTGYLMLYDYESSSMIYDFTVGATNMLPFDVSAIDVINGKIVCTGTGVVILDFKNNTGRWIQSATDKTYSGNISTRNNGLSYA